MATRMSDTGPLLQSDDREDAGELLERLVTERVAPFRAELDEIRRQLAVQAEELDQLKAEREAVCCPWWAQSWHRRH